MRRAVSIGVLLSVLVVPAVADAARPLRTGIVDPAQLAHADPVTADLAFARIAGSAGNPGTGAQFVKIYVNWRGMAPTPPDDGRNPNDPVYVPRWDRLDNQVTRAAANGLTPIIYMANAPEWAEEYDGTFEGSGRPNPTALAEFMTALATRYSGEFPDLVNPLPRVRYWMVWNEPNARVFLSPQFVSGRLVSPAWYRTMLNRSAEALKAADSLRDGRNVVITGGMAPFGHTSIDARPLAFMRSLLCLRKNLTPRRSCTPATFDVWDTHPYTSGQPTRHARWADDVSIGDLPEMRRVLRAAARAGKIRRGDGVLNRSPHFWVTEFSWDTRPPDRQAVPLSLHARWVSEALYRMWRSGITLVTWFKLVDARKSDPWPECRYQSGFYTVGGSVKPSLQAFRFPFVAFKSRTRLTIWGRTPDSTGGRVRIERRTRSGWKLVTRDTANRYGIFQKRFRSSLKRGSLRAKVSSSGEASRRFSLSRPRDRSVHPFGTPTC